MRSGPRSNGVNLGLRFQPIGSFLCGLLLFGVASVSAQPTTTSPARVDIHVEASSKPLSAGSSGEFVVRVSNSGGAAPGAGRLLVPSPAGTSGLAWTCASSGAGKCAAARGSGAVDASLAGLVGQSSLEYVFSMDVAAAAPPFIAIEASAAIAATDRCADAESAPCRAFASLPTGPRLQLEMQSSNAAVAPHQQVQYSISVRSQDAAANTNGTVIRSPVPHGLVSSHWTCTSGVGACASLTGIGPIEERVGDFSRGDIRFQVSATVASDPPTAIVPSVVALPPFGGSCANFATGGSNDRSAPCTARTLLSTEARILASRSEDHRGSEHGVSSRFEFENIGARMDGSRVTSTLPEGATGLAWTCSGQGMQCPQASGNGSIEQTIAVWPASARLTYDLSVETRSVASSGVGDIMQVMPSAPASCGLAGTPPPCTATQPLSRENAGLRLQQTVDRLGAGPGELVRYGVTLVSDDSAPIGRDVVLSVPLPAGIEDFVSWACVAAEGSATTCPERSGKGAIRQAFAQLAPSSKLDYFIRARVGAAPPAIVLGRATLTAPNSASLGCADSAGTVSDCVATSEFSSVPVLALDQSTKADSLEPGSPINYVMDVFNLGAKADSVRVRSLLPAGIAGISWICNGLGMDCPATSGSGNVSSSLQQVPSGGGVSYQVAAHVENPVSTTSSSVLTAIPSVRGRCHKDASEASAAAPCIDRTDSSFSATLQLSQAATEQQLLRGGVIHHTLTLTNHGQAASNSRISLPMANGITHSDWTCTGFAGATCPRTSGSGAIDELIATLPINASLTYAIRSVLSAEARNNVSLQASTTPGAKAMCAHDICSDTLSRPITEVPSAHLQVGVESAQSFARAGSTGIWTIDVRNLGSERAGPFSISNLQPADTVRVLSWTCAGVECPAASGTGPINQRVALLSVYDPERLPEASAAGRLVFTVEAEVGSVPGPNAELAVALQPTTGDTCAPLGCELGLQLPTEPLGGELVFLQFGPADGQFVEPVRPSSTVEYRFDVFHGGKTPVSLSLYSVAPEGIVSSTWSCSGKGGSCPPAGSGDINESITLLGGGGVSFAISAQTDSVLPPTLDYLAGVNVPPPFICDPATCMVTSSVPSVGQEQLSLTADTSSVQPDSTVNYTFTIVNFGGTDDSGFNVSALSPPDFVSTSWTCVGTGNAQCAPSGSGPLDTFVELLPPGDSVTYTISATVGSDLQPTIDYVVQLQQFQSAPLFCQPESCSASLSLPSGTGMPGRLSITKTANRNDLFPGGGVRYTIHVENTGAAYAAAQLVDLLPTGLSAFYWTCTASGDAGCEEASGTGSLDQYLEAIGPASSVTFAVDADVDDNAVGSVVNRAQLFVDDVECEQPNCEAVRSLPVRIPTQITVSKSVFPASGSPVGVNQPIAWTLRASNSGGATATPLTLTDTLPSGIRDISVSVTGGIACNTATPAPGSNLICTIPDGFTGEHSVTISAAVDGSAGASISNTVRATGVNGVDCSSCTVSNPVRPSYDIALVNPRPFSAGGVQGSLVDVVNLSQGSVQGATLTVTPAASVRLLGPFTSTCTTTIDPDGNVSVVCPDPPPSQGVSCTGNNCSFGELVQGTATTVFVALGDGTTATMQLSSVGDSDPSNNSVGLPAGSTP